MREFKGTPTLRFFHDGTTLVKIERADIPEAFGALCAVADAEDLLDEELFRATVAALDVPHSEIPSLLAGDSS